MPKFLVTQVCTHSVIVEASSAEAALNHVQEYGDDDFPREDWDETEVAPYTGEDEADETAGEDEEDDDD